MEPVGQPQSNDNEWDRGIGRTSSAELEGTIPILCSARATVETMLIFPPVTKPQYEEKKYAVRQFYMELSHVVNLALEVLDRDIVKEYNIWRKSKIYDPYNSDENTLIALDIERKVQDDLYKKGYKDTNRSESLPFPIECYLEE